MKAKRFLFLLIGISCIFALSQCNKSEFDIDPIVPIDPLFDFSSVAFIARITNNSADWSLCVMDKSGNNMRKIVDKTVACQKPVRSNSGTQLLFTVVKFDYWVDENNSFNSSSLYELCIVNTDGTGLTIIDRIDKSEVGTFGSADWSPDDKYIIYVKRSGASLEKHDLILYNISNKTHTILQTKSNICSPKFSPDGKHIAYCASTETGHHIYKMDVNGKNSQLIISNGSLPRWSQQSDKIAFISSGIDRSSQISVADADGSNQKQLTTTVSPGWWDSGFPRGGNSNPQWTPDGKKIVYVSSENEREEIFIMNADGSNQTRLTNAQYWDGSPEITPDGKYILFHSRRSDMMESGIIMMKLDGSSQKVLSKVGANPIACR